MKVPHAVKSLTRSEAVTVLHYWARTHCVLHRRYRPLFWYSPDYNTYWPTTELFNISRNEL